MAKKQLSKKQRSALIYAIVLIALLLFAPETLLVELGILSPSQSIPTAEGNLTAHILDVGQGDSILLISPSGKTMLVDAGEASAFENISAALDGLDISRLDVVVASHPHSDHIGAMYKVIRQYDVGAFYMPEAVNTTSSFDKMLSALEEKNVPVQVVWGSDRSTIPWDSDVTVQVLSPVKGESYDDLNNWSIVLRVKYGNTAIMLTADAEYDAEELMLNGLDYSLFRSDVLKLGHHGSSTSTSEAFLQAVDPQYLIASVGEGNDYGHPHRETLQLAKDYNLPLYRTDTMGTVTVVLDGSTASVTTQR